MAIKQVEVPMEPLANREDEDGRLLCPICDEPISATEPTMRVGDYALHFKCLERSQQESDSR